MFHVWLWVKDETNSSLFFSIILIFNNNLEAINHFADFSPYVPGVTVLVTEHIVSTEGAALNEFLLAI